MKTLNEYAREIMAINTDHGFIIRGWEQMPEKIALMHSELSEALEEVRDAKMPTGTWRPTGAMMARYESSGPTETPKPVGFAVELIDCMIRILHVLGHYDVDVDVVMQAKMDYNRTRPFMHGRQL